MKKVLTTLFLVLIFGLTGYSQTDTHLTFRDVPIDGNVNAFAKKLEAKGFTLVKNHEEVNKVVMSGKFLNANCEVLIECTPNSKLASQVVIYMPEDSSWRDLKSRYLTLKELYTNKYGTPTALRETFISPYYEGDGDEIDAVKNEQCTFAIYWKLPNGIISVIISKYLQVGIIYSDTQNSEIEDDERLDNIIELYLETLYGD